MLLNLLNALSGIYFDAPDDGGGGMSIEELTNQKLNGDGDDEPEPEPKKNPANADDEPEPDPDPDDDIDDDDYSDDPDPDDDEADLPGGDDDDGDGDSDETFFDPEVHVEGKPAHSNKFKTREQAEYAAISKADLLKSKIDEMKEDGVNPGAIPLPKALENNLDNIDQFTSLEFVNAMDDDELRNFLNESDATRQRFDEKHKRVKGEKVARETKNRYEEVQVELFDDLEQIMGTEQIQANIDKLGKKESAKDFIKTAIDGKVKEELQPMRDDLEAWIDKVDSGEINLSIKEYDEQKQQKVDAIETKAQQLRDQYKGVDEKVDELYSLHEKVESGDGGGPSPEVVRQNMFNAFDEFQKDRSGIMPILDDDPSAKAELVAAKKFAIQNKEQFNNLQTPNDWVQAIDKGWTKHKENIRANNQRKQLSNDNKKRKGKGSKDDVPRPGDQSKLNTKFDMDAVHSSNKRSLDKLEELTNSRI